MPDQLGRAIMSTMTNGKERTHGNDTIRRELCYTIKPSLAVLRVEDLSPFHPITAFLL